MNDIQQKIEVYEKNLIKFQNRVGNETSEVVSAREYLTTVPHPLIDAGVQSLIAMGALRDQFRPALTNAWIDAKSQRIYISNGHTLLMLQVEPKLQYSLFVGADGLAKHISNSNTPQFPVESCKSLYREALRANSARHVQDDQPMITCLNPKYLAYIPKIAKALKLPKFVGAQILPNREPLAPVLIGIPSPKHATIKRAYLLVMPIRQNEKDPFVFSEI